MSNVSNKRVNIYIDQTAAENALENLQKKADGVNKKIEACRESQNKLLDAIAKNEAAGKPVDKLRNQYQELQIKINSFNKDVRENKTAMDNVQEQINKGLRPSMAQLERQVNSLKNQLRNLSEDAPGYAEKFKAFQLASAHLDKLKTSINGVGKAQSTWFDQAKTMAVGVLAGNILSAIGTGIASYVGGIVTGNAKLADSLKDVEKATGKSSAEVEKLNSDLGKIDTRTARADLREIAIGLGQINEEANKANVEAIDKIVVALGDEFGGGAREITNALSVLRNNLQDIKTGNYADDILHIGNALNVAGASGLATAPVVTEVTNRISGIAESFHVSSGKILGIASVFQELGIETERGSTAVVKLFQKIAAEPEKFAAVAGKSVKEFTDLVNTDMVGAFIEVAKGAKTAGSSNVLFGKILKDLDADGSGAGEVISKLGTNYALLDNKVTLMTNALKESSSITDEFIKKNTGLGAELSKLEKSFNSLIASQTLTDILIAGVHAISGFIAVLRAVPQWLKENQSGLYLLIAGIAIMNASYIKAGALIIRDTALKIKNAIVTKGTAVATNIAIAAQAAWITITELLTGRITLAIAAQRLWNITMSLGAGPIGAILLVVGALTVGIISLYNATHKLTAAQQLQKDIQQKVVENTSDQVSKIEILKQVINDNTVSLDNRKKALQALIDINPKYLQGLTLENFHTEEGKKKLDEYIASLKTKAEVEAKTSLLTDKIKQRDSAIISLKAQADFSGFSTEDFEKYAAGAAKSAEKSSLFGLFKTAKLGDVDLLALNDAFQQIKILQNDIGEAAKKDIETVIITATTTAQAAADTIGDIKKQISQLDDDLDKIDKKNTTAINENRNQRKKLQDELNKLIGENGISKKIEYDANKASEQWDKLIDKINENIAKLTQNPFTFELGKILKDRIDQLKEIDKLGKDAGKSTKEITGAKLLVEESTLATVQKLISNSSNLKQKPFELHLAPHLDLLDNDEISKVGEQIKKHLNEEQRDALAKASLDVLQSHGRDRLNAQLALLDKEKEQELLSKEHTENEKALIEEQYRQKRGEAELTFFQSQIESIQQVLNFGAQTLEVLSKFNSAKEAKENAALNKELKSNDAKKTSYKRMLDNKIISQREYESKIAALDKATEKKKQDLEKKQFERNKKMQIAQALVNGAMGITSVLAARPGPTDIISLGLFRAINIALTVATTAAQVASIANSKYALGGRTKGPSHTQSGLPVINPQTGQKVAELEGDEGILKKSAMLSSKSYTLTGTPSQITSTLNAAYGGIKWDSTAMIRPAYQRNPFHTVDVNRIAKSFTAMKFAEGGVFNQSTQSTNQPVNPSTDPALLQTLQQSQAINMQLMQTVASLHAQLKQPLQAEVPLKKIQDAEAMQNRILENATFK